MFQRLVKDPWNCHSERGTCRYFPAVSFTEARMYYFKRPIKNQPGNKKEIAEKASKIFPLGPNLLADRKQKPN